MYLYLLLLSETRFQSEGIGSNNDNNNDYNSNINNSIFRNGITYSHLLLSLLLSLLQFITFGNVDFPPHQ